MDTNYWTILAIGLVIVLMAVVVGVVAYQNEKMGETICRRAENLGVPTEVVKAVLENMLPFDMRILAALDDEAFAAEIKRLCAK